MVESYMVLASPEYEVWGPFQSVRIETWDVLIRDAKM